MTQVLGEFIKALRANDVRVTTSETVEAGATLALVGYADRPILREALAQALAKSVEEKQYFYETFDSFFAFRAFDESAGERRQTAPDGAAPEPPAPEPGEGEGEGQGDGKGQGGGGEQSRRRSRGGAAQDAGPEDESETGEEADERRRESLTALLERDDRAGLQQRLEEAARTVNLNDIKFFTQRGLFALRILTRMGIEPVDAFIEALEGRGENARAARLAAARERLAQATRDYVDQQLALFAANAGRLLREEMLAETRLSAIERGDMRLMRELVRKMAKKLVARHSRRRRIDRRGQLDLRRTIRANIEYDGLLFHTVWRRRKIERPKILALCDVSGSVAQVSRFLLMFLYSVQEVLPDVRSFAFSGRLGEVTDLFAREPFETAMAQTLAHFGGSTDYGQALATFETLALEQVDRRTTVLILGDARNNGGEPRADILRLVHERARRVIFLNPEPRSSWNVGDSVMARYAPACDVVKSCSTLKDLERIVDELMRVSA